jgi:hypothetical protein
MLFITITMKTAAAIVARVVVIGVAATLEAAGGLPLEGREYEDMIQSGVSGCARMRNGGGVGSVWWGEEGREGMAGR